MVVRQTLRTELSPQLPSIFFFFFFASFFLLLSILKKKKKKTGPCYEGLAWNFLLCVDQASFELVIFQPFHVKC